MLPNLIPLVYSAIPASETGLEWRQTIPISTSTLVVPASATNEYPLHSPDRDIRHRNIDVWVISSVVSGAPATNTMRAEVWNITDATKIAQATITGTTGTQLERMSRVTIATLSDFIGPGADASAYDVFAIKFVGANTLSKPLKQPTVEIIADIID